jgi:hypothetical protein
MAQCRYAKGEFRFEVHRVLHPGAGTEFSEIRKVGRENLYLNKELFEILSK